MAVTTFTQALFDKICDELADGKSLRSVCEKKSMPDRKTFNRWRQSTVELQQQYDRACLDREEAYFEQIIDIADAATDQAKARNQIDARKWTLARMNRKKFGDHVTEELTGPNGGPLQIERVRLNMKPVEELPE